MLRDIERRHLSQQLHTLRVRVRFAALVHSKAMAWFPGPAAPGQLPPPCECELCPGLTAQLDVVGNQYDQFVLLMQLKAVHGGLGLDQWRNHLPTAYYVGRLYYWNHNESCCRCGPDTPAELNVHGSYDCTNPACGKCELCACADCTRFVEQFPACPNMLHADRLRETYAEAQAFEEREEAEFAAGPQ